MGIRIVHVVPSLDPGGLENGLVNVIGRTEGEVLDHGHVLEHAVICLERRGALAERLPASVPVVVAGKRRGNDPLTYVQTARLARGLRADVIHTRNWGSLLEGAAAAHLLRARHVHGLHGRTQLELDGVSPRRRIIEGFVCRRADRVYALLPSLEAEVKALGVAPGRSGILENGVDLERFAPDPAARARLRKELAVSEKDVLVGCVARLDPVKDHATLLRACAKLPPKGTLVLAGDGALRRSLEQLARLEGIGPRVRFLGHRKDSIYPALDAFVLASKYEGFSNTILEAMACGLAVIATDTGGNPSLVSPRTGVLVPVGDAQALGSALTRIVNDAKQRRAMGEAGLAFARERSLERMARNYSDLYRSLFETPSHEDAKAPAEPDAVAQRGFVPSWFPSVRGRTAEVKS